MKIMTRDTRENNLLTQLLNGLKLVLLLAIVFSASEELQAQKTKSFSGVKDLLKLNISNPDEDFKEIEFTADLKTEELKKGAVATFSLSAKIPEGFHLYTQKKTNIAPTVIKLMESPGLVAIDSEFIPNKKSRSTYDLIMKATYEDYEGTITWTRRFRIEDPNIATVKGTITGQYCSSGENGKCIPINPAHKYSTKLVVDTANSTVATPVVKNPSPKAKQTKTIPVKIRPYSQTVRPTRSIGDKQKLDPVEFTFKLNPENAKPGDIVTLSIHAKFDEEWHAYGLHQNPEYYGEPTIITVDGVQGLKSVSDEGFQPNPHPETKKPFEDEEAFQLVHHHEVTWSKEFEVLPDAKDGTYGLAGSISYQVCKNLCLPLKKIAYELGNVSHLKPALSFSSKKLAGTIEINDVDEDRGLLSYLIFAFLGGIILNVMPCVLPVLAIKVMSFVQQAGESRSRIFMLNLTYAVGVILVFLILASLAAFLKVGWGGLFQDTRFKISMACLIFAMGLSLLGVFELPIPGLIGSAAGNQQKEGLPGAFLTGIFATLLATPCSGPFLGPVLGWSVSQPTGIIYLIWGTMGLGMAFPYIIFGIFPNAIKFLPKPGMWMVRFKEISGFVLMGTLIFIIQSIKQEYILTLLIMLLGIAIALWMIGNLYITTSPASRKRTVRFSALVVVVGISGFGFMIMNQSNKLEWQDFSEARLEQLISQEKTVLIDFTADWCTNCKFNERFALNTSQTKAFIEMHDIVPLVADYTNKSEEIKRWLDTFKSISVPLTVIFPAKNPQKPIILRDLYKQSQLMTKLNEAVEISNNANAESENSQESVSAN